MRVVAEVLHATQIHRLLHIWRPATAIGAKVARVRWRNIPSAEHVPVHASAHASFATEGWQARLRTQGRSGGLGSTLSLIATLLELITKIVARRSISAPRISWLPSWLPATSGSK